MSDEQLSRGARDCVFFVRLPAAGLGKLTFTISAASTPRGDLKETDFDRLRSALGKQLSSVPDNVSKVDFVEGYIERAKERWESDVGSQKSVTLRNQQLVIPSSRALRMM